MKLKRYKTTGDKNRLQKPTHFQFRLLTLPLFLLSVVILQSCATARYETGNAVASWYGSEFQGKPTASGEIFNMYAYTCAHKEYPFGTILRVINLSSDESVICIVNDRGPFVSGRDIDLSYAAAKEIGLIEAGTARVWIQNIGRDSSYKREVQYQLSDGPFTIQVGSFQDLSNAEHLKKALSLKYASVYMKEADVRGKMILPSKNRHVSDKSSSRAAWRNPC